ncbi:MAG: hypothetical protein LBK29_01900 [Oscillospiraceae bacterium]|nr:hypothetical protein [Oscillospiraceae bacterium]
MFFCFKNFRKSNFIKVINKIVCFLTIFLFLIPNGLISKIYTANNFDQVFSDEASLNIEMESDDGYWEKSEDGSWVCSDVDYNVTYERECSVLVSKEIIVKSPSVLSFSWSLNSVSEEDKLNYWVENLSDKSIIPGGSISDSSEEKEVNTDLNPNSYKIYFSYEQKKPTEESTDPWQEPTELPTEEPTEEPPSEKPSEEPTEAPDEEPTEEPSEEPTEETTEETTTEEPAEEPSILSKLARSDLAKTGATIKNLKLELQESEIKLNFDQWSNGVRVVADEGNFPADSTLDVKVLHNDPKYIAIIKENLDNYDEVERFNAYEINVIDPDGNKISNFDSAEIWIKTPNDFDIEDLYASFVTPDIDQIFNGKTEIFDGNKYFVFNTDHFSPYVLIDKKTEKKFDQWSNGVRVVADEGNFPADSTLDVKVLRNDPKYIEIIKENLDNYDEIELFNAYEIDVIDPGGNKISNFDSAEIWIETSNDFDIKDLHAHFLTSNIDQIFNKKIKFFNKNKYFVFNTNRFSPYVLIDKLKEKNSVPNPKTGVNYQILIFSSVLILSLFIFIIIKKQKELEGFYA